MAHIDTCDLIEYMHRPTLRIAFHLALCSNCRADLRFVRLLKEAVQDLPVVPEELIERTKRAIDDCVAAVPREPPWWLVETGN